MPVGHRAGERQRPIPPAGAGAAAVHPVRDGVEHAPRHRRVLRPRRHPAARRRRDRERRDHQVDGRVRPRHQHRPVPVGRAGDPRRQPARRADRRPDAGARDRLGAPAGGTRAAHGARDDGHPRTRSCRACGSRRRRTRSGRPRPADRLLRTRHAPALHLRGPLVLSTPRRSNAGTVGCSDSVRARLHRVLSGNNARHGSARRQRHDRSGNGHEARDRRDAEEHGWRGAAARARRACRQSSSPRSRRARPPTRLALDSCPASR